MIDMLPPPEIPPEDGVKELTAAEIETLKPVFYSFNQALPDPSISRFVGVVQGGKVVAFLVLQLRLHAEPLWIAEGHSDLLLPLARKAEEIILERVGAAYVYLTVPDGRIKRLAELLGFLPEPYTLMSKMVVPNTPSRTAPFGPELEEEDTKPNEQETVQ